jgi:hypothetical protein
MSSLGSYQEQEKIRTEKEEVEVREEVQIKEELLKKQQEEKMKHDKVERKNY